MSSPKDPIKCRQATEKRLATMRRKNNGAVFSNLQMENASKKRKQTNLEKYGTECPSQNLDVKKKTELSNIEKWGVKYPMQLSCIQAKAKQTNFERYGEKSPAQRPEILQKMKQTNLERYGVENANQNQDINRKARQTSIKKYGTEYYAQSVEFKENQKQHCLQKYGVTYQFQREDVKNKSREALLKKYGFEYFSQFVSCKYKEKHAEQILNLNCSGLSDNAIANKLQLNQPTVSKLLRKQGVTSRSITYPEQQIIELFRSEFPGIEISIHNKTMLIRKNKWPLEIDVYIPSLNLGIEVNGFYWHKNDPKGRIHNKWSLAKEKGIDILNLDCESKLSKTQLQIVKELLS